jgi:hypothetical protein
MSNLTVSATFTKNSGQPATALTLAEINLYLTAVNKTTGDRTVIWDGTQHPQFEVTNTGAYGRIYASADFDTYHYFATANYTGLTSLDQDWITGSASLETSVSLTTPVATVTAAVSGTTITVYRGTTWLINITGLGNISAYDTIYFSVKKFPTDEEADAVLRVYNDASGLLRFNGAEPIAATNGFIIINDATTGDITITVKPAETVSAPAASALDYDIKGVDDNGNVVLLAYGTESFAISPDITQAYVSPA